MIMKIPNFLQNHLFWVLVIAITYVVSGITDSETNWQVVIAIAAYLGGTSLKDFARDFLDVLRRIDAILDRAGIQWENVLEDALEKIKDRIDD
jgi:hypothetical protein